MRRTREIALALVSGALLLASPLPLRASEPIVADLDGRPIRTTEVGSHNCHDFEFPRIHCFETVDALDLSVARYGAGPLTAPAGVTYVRIWEHESYAGSSAYLSNNYADLGTIGWNDKITSFKSFNAQSGAFYEHNSYAGLVYSFCCNTSVWNVGGSYNDRFSSVRNLT